MAHNTTQFASWIRLSSFSVVLLAWVVPSATAQIKLVTPLEGTPFVDWVIGNYVDVDHRPIARADYRGGRYTYDGHNGLDYGLAHFRKMEEGIGVLAAAPGTVVSVLDGAYDRWSGSNPNPPGEIGNIIVIDHGQGINTIYAHLRKDSTTVKAGDLVSAGQRIAEVGSSGGSTGPHLHFSVQQHGHYVETYLEPEKWWYDPLPYTDDAPGTLDFGIASHWPTLEEFEEGVKHRRVFSASDGPGQLAAMWNYAFGIPKGSEVSVRFSRPNGATFADFKWTEQLGLNVGFWIHGVVLPPVPDLGIWTAELRVNNNVISQSRFRVVESIPEPSSGFMALFFGLCLSRRARFRV